MLSRPFLKIGKASKINLPIKILAWLPTVRPSSFGRSGVGIGSVQLI